MFQGLTDPIPYITAAYCLAFVSIAGYTAWIFKSRSKLNRILAVIEKEKRKN